MPSLKFSPGMPWIRVLMFTPRQILPSWPFSEKVTKPKRYFYLNLCPFLNQKCPFLIILLDQTYRSAQVECYREIWRYGAFDRTTKRVVDGSNRKLCRVLENGPGHQGPGKSKGMFILFLREKHNLGEIKIRGRHLPGKSYLRLGFILGGRPMGLRLL